MHSIPSGVIGVARYMTASVPLAAWVGQLDRRQIPQDLDALLPGHTRVVLVRVHEVGEPAPEDDWLRRHADSRGNERSSRPRSFTSVPKRVRPSWRPPPRPPAGKFGTCCPATNRSAAIPGHIPVPRERRASGYVEELQAVHDQVLGPAPRRGDPGCRTSASKGGRIAREPVLRYAQCGVEVAMTSSGRAIRRSQSSAASWVRQAWV